MYELALFILDLAQNSLSAQANLIKVWVDESAKTDRLHVVVADNGHGMTEDMSKRAIDPFMTTKSRKKKIGLGLPLFKSLMEMCEGDFKLRSTPGKGTVIYGWIPLHNIDQPPLGNMADTIFALVVGTPTVNFRYTHKKNGQTKVFDTRPVRKVLGKDAIALWQSAEVLEWFGSAIAETN